MRYKIDRPDKPDPRRPEIHIHLPEDSRIDEVLRLLCTLNERMDIFMALTVEQQLQTITRIQGLNESVTAAFAADGLVAQIVAKALADAGIGAAQVGAALESLQPSLDSAEAAIKANPTQGQGQRG